MEEKVEEENDFLQQKIDVDTMKLYIGGINPAWTTDVIKNLLQKHSSTDIMRVDVVKNFAFAFVATKEAGQKVIDKVNGETIEGHKLLIQISKNKQNLPDSEDLCFECGKAGHWAKECAKRKARIGSGRVSRGRGGYGYGGYPPAGGREREAYGAYGAPPYGMNAYQVEYYPRDPYQREAYSYAPMPRYAYEYGRYPPTAAYGRYPPTATYQPAADIYGPAPARYAAPPRYMYHGGGY